MKLSQTLFFAAIALGIAAGTGSAFAQDQQTQPAPQRVPEQNQPTRPPGEGSTVPQSDGSLSHHLSRSQGVIRPPETGDQGVVPPPSEGSQSMPVIPPPGSPEGNQNIQPK
jgi:hypothetical protein